MIYGGLGIVLGITFILIQLYVCSSWIKQTSTSDEVRNNHKIAFLEELDKNGPYPTRPGSELIQSEALLTLRSIISKHAYKKFYPRK